MLRQRRLTKQPRLTREELARQGHAIYLRKIRSKLAGEKKGRVVAIDIDTGDFRVADTVLPAAEPLLARRPDANIWMERIGFPTLRHFGGWRHSGKSK